MRLYFVALVALAVVGCDEEMIEEAQEAVRKSQKDSGTVHFQNAHRCPSRDGVWGFFNAKDSSGAYAGFKIFVHRNGRLFLDGDPATNEQLDRCYTIPK